MQFTGFAPNRTILAFATAACAGFANGAAAQPLIEVMPPTGVVEEGETTEPESPQDVPPEVREALQPDVAGDPGGEEYEPHDVAPAGEPEPPAERGAADVELAAAESTVRLQIPGHYQISVFGLADMRLAPVDESRDRVYPPTLGQEMYGWGRLRATPALTFPSVAIKAQFDVMTGMIFGDSSVGVDAAVEPRMREAPSGPAGESGELVGIRPFDLRRLYVEWDTGYGILRAGQQASQWGLGLLANGGDADQVWGLNRYGDLVERIAFATKPLNTVTETFLRDLIVVAGGDLVYRDHLADLWEGDLAWQGIFALLYKEDRNSAGVYVAYRNQTFDDGDTLEVVAVDGAFDWLFDLAPSWYLQVAAEGVAVMGSTDVARSIQRDSHDVQQLGGAVRAAVKYLDTFTGQIEFGAATGDSNTLDGQLLRFTFDPDYNVGLLMFEELLAWQTARAATMGGSPELVGEPPPGLDLLPTNGGVAGALYVNPTVRYRPCDWFDGALGVLWGYATSDLVSPFEQKVSGAPRNYVGGDSGRRNLGTEIDLALNFHVPLRMVALRAGIQAGYLFLGEAFADASGERGDDIWLAEGRLRLDF